MITLTEHEYQDFQLMRIMFYCQRYGLSRYKLDEALRIFGREGKDAFNRYVMDQSGDRGDVLNARVDMVYPPCIDYIHDVGSDHLVGDCQMTQAREIANMLQDAQGDAWYA